MTSTRQISLDMIDRFNEIKADLCTVQAAIESNPAGYILASVGNTLARIITRYEDVLWDCGEVPTEEATGV